ncbi:uncharacterized protein ACLA_027400 [Aspergillus clavatus NRRL 1]|uniref:Uncharacterized protein n=1 Tax=Aspergillus clavatus (strain ATCC 1007 / CBS 513.65 / DSM 816 / NCTC 3887 / NRRL 1 / QM 1276 / 107) TaxID=344612 RepID=A1CQU7_ASPCL|nr:uncharacterized protein ACLA_027400 [Aspergillus clavatus NRRL 1]EAW08018.1 conserved hypothetical protein [Aspergillus clavatus NRRL 1]
MATDRSDDSVEIMLDIFELDKLGDAEFQRILHFKLHLAIMENDIAAVKQMLIIGADPNFRNEMGFTAVEWADTLRNVDALKVLLQDVDIAHNGIELLAEHIRNKHPAVVAVLLEMGVKSFLSRNVLLHQGLILLACHIGHVTVVSLLIRCIPWYRITPSKQIFLQTAAAAQNDDVLELLRSIAREEQESLSAPYQRLPLIPVYAPPRDVEFDRLFNEFIREDAYLP